MTDTLASLEAHRSLPGTMTACSWQAGWRSLLLRAYQDPPAVDEFTTPATPDHLVVLVTGGSCQLEGHYRGAWHRISHRSGSIGMTAPGEEVTLRWRGATVHRTLQLHLPAATIEAVQEELHEQRLRRRGMPHGIAHDDPILGRMMLSLREAMSARVPDLYAETAAHFLGAHLLLGRTDTGAPRGTIGEDLRMRRVDDFLRAHISHPVKLEDIAKVAGVSRFHLVRLFRQAYQETPLRRLTRMRMDEARVQLSAKRRSIAEIAFACGYDDSAHFAVAFRRWVGMSPTQYRRLHRIR